MNLEGSLDEVIRCPFKFIWNEKRQQWFFRYEKKDHFIVEIGLLANGIRDIRVIRKSSSRGDFTLKVKSEARPEEIVYSPLGDVLCLAIEPPIGQIQTLFLDLGSDLSEQTKEFVRKLLRTGDRVHRGKDFEMFGGDDYGQDSLKWKDSDNKSFWRKPE